MGLPEVELGTSWGDRPTYKVRGKGFLLFRMPHKSAVDPETGRAVRRPARHHHAHRGREAGPGRGRGAAVLHDRRTSRATTRCSSSSPGWVRSSATSWRRSSPTPGSPRPRSRWRGPSSRVAMVEPRSRRTGAAAHTGDGSAGPSDRGRPVPRRRASTCSRPCASTRPTPTSSCPRSIKHYKLTGRDAAFTTELASGTIRLRGTYDAIIGACADRPITKIEARVLDATAARRAPAAVDAGARARRDQHHRRPRAPAVQLRRRGLRQRGAAGGLRARPREWVAQVAPDARTQPHPAPVDRLQPPRVGRRRAARAPSARTSCRRCWPPTTPHPP